MSVVQTTNDIRSLFLDFFKKNRHTIVKSSPLIPANDPSLMFTAAGMVPFKDVFLGKETRDYTRAVSSQKCVRAGGKHNDLENVGHTKRHLTFFEMLGNFSFGDYFKEDAIKYAWDFITRELQFNKNKLYITTYHTDDESFKIWKKVTGLEDNRIIKISTNDNFWSMGDTGPSGPCSEIFYDQGSQFFGGLPGTKDQDGDRYVEIWNLVFMEHEQLASGERINLSKKSVDTGMGLERTAAIMQGVYDNFEIDTFKAIINVIEDITSCKASNNTAHRVIADHLRSCAFLIADGVMPSNEGRGYVLRRILRRAIRYVNQLGYKDILMYKLLPVLIGEMGTSYPELIKGEQFIADVFRQEEEMFITTLDRGMKLLNDKIKDLKPNAMLTGDVAFKLHDTYGFPVDLTQDILRDKKIKVDVGGFEQLMTVQKNRARKAWTGSGEEAVKDLWFGIKDRCGTTEFLGYNATDAKGKIVALVQNNSEIESLDNKEKFHLITNQTPFYGECGGQMGDIGEIQLEDKLHIKVLDTQKPLPGFHAHLCQLQKGKVKVGDVVDLIVNKPHRDELKRNHTATHLLHAALRSKLGEHVVQKGSLVAQDRLRFDFSHREAIARSVLDEIEKEVNTLIFKDYEVTTQLMKHSDAIKKGAMALFGEKYEDEVRVVSIEAKGATHSIELCGGTHVTRLGELGVFKILYDTAIAAGVRRIEAVTATEALACFQNSYNLLKEAATTLQVKEEDITDKINEISQNKKKLEKELSKIKQINLSDLLKKAQTQQIGEIVLISDSFENSNLGELRNLAQQHVLNNSNNVVLLFSVLKDSIGLVCGVSKNIKKQVKANNILDIVMKEFNGKGGGSDLIAQAVGQREIKSIEKSKNIVISLLNDIKNEKA